MPGVEAPRRIAVPRRALAGGGAELPATTLLGALCLASAAMLVGLGSRLTFFNDDWVYIFQRPRLTADSIFTPVNGQPVVLLEPIYRGMIAVFGLHSQVPFRLLLAAAVVAVAVTVYLFVRPRAGQALALIAATLLLFLGSASEAMLFFASLSLVGSLAAGVGVLVVLDADSPRRNVAASVLLVLSIALSNLGVAFVVAATVAVLLRRRPRQLWIVAVPTAIYAAWWISYGRHAPSALSAANLRHLPAYVLDSLTSALGSLAGTGWLSAHVGTGWSTAVWGRPLLALALLGAAVRLHRGHRPSARVLVVGVAALAFWVLTGANYIPGREPIAGRYQIISGALVLLFAAELLRPVRLPPRSRFVVGGVAALAIMANVSLMVSGYRFFRHESSFAKADFGALDVVRGHVTPPGFQDEPTGPLVGNVHLPGVTPRAYYRETAAHGALPAYSPAQIAAAPLDQRHGADRVLVAGSVQVEPLPHRPPPRGHLRCRRLTREAVLAPGVAVITNRGGRVAILGLRRFAPPGVPAYFAFVVAGASVRLRVAADAVALPWHLETRGGSPLATLSVCT